MNITTESVNIFVQESPLPTEPCQDLIGMTQEIRVVHTGNWQTRVRRWASKFAHIERMIPPFSAFLVIGYIEGEEIMGDKRWWIDASGFRVSVTATIEKPSEV